MKRIVERPFWSGGPLFRGCGKVCGPILRVRGGLMLRVGDALDSSMLRGFGGLVAQC